MWVVQVDFDFFGSCAGGIPLLLPRDGPVLPWRTLHPTVWPLQPCCILQWGASPSLITTPAWGRETAHPRGPNNCCYRQTRDRGHHQHLHTTGLKKVHKPSNQLWATVQRLPIFFIDFPQIIEVDLASSTLISFLEFPNEILTREWYCHPWFTFLHCVFSNVSCDWLFSNVCFQMSPQMSPNEILTR